MTLINVVGQVKDAETGEPLQGVTVTRLLGGSENHLSSNTVTDGSGMFNIPIDGQDGLAFSHVGYQSEVYKSGGLLFQTANKINLVKDYKTLPGVIVTPSGSAIIWVSLAIGAAIYFSKKR